MKRISYTFEDFGDRKVFEIGKSRSSDSEILADLKEVCEKVPLYQRATFFFAILEDGKTITAKYNADDAIRMLDSQAI